MSTTHRRVADRCLDLYTQDPLLQSYIVNNAVHMELSRIIAKAVVAGVDYDVMEILRTAAQDAYFQCKAAIRADES